MARLGLALVGCGEVTGAKHLPALRRVPALEVRVLVDPDREKRERLGDRFRIEHRVADLAAALAIGGIDAVGVATPPAVHETIAVAAMDAGRHVWIDKPLALSAPACRRIIDAAHRSTAVVMTGFHMRYHRLVREARAIIASGQLGRIESLRSTWYSPRADEGLPAWRWHRESGGGALAEIGVHLYDLWRYLLNTDVQELHAVAINGTRNDESAVVTARLANGALATAHLSERTSHQIELEVAGSRGRLRVDCLRFEGLEWLPVATPPGSPRARVRRSRQFVRTLPAGLRSMAHGGEYLDSYRVAWDAFARAAMAAKAPTSASRDGMIDICTATDGLRATEIMVAALASRAEGRSVTLPCVEHTECP